MAGATADLRDESVHVAPAALARASSGSRNGAALPVEACWVRVDAQGVDEHARNHMEKMFCRITSSGIAGLNSHAASVLVLPS